MKAVNFDFLKKIYPKRHEWDRKGDAGRVLVIGGSRRYKGAPALCALAALRTGADIVTVAAPETAADVIASFSPDIITEPLQGDYIDIFDVDRLLGMSARFDAVVIGNGLGRMKRTAQAVGEFLKVLEKPCVIDADALHMISGEKGSLNPGWVITPHSGEFYNLSGKRPVKSLEKRAADAKKFSREIKATVLLKGHRDVITNGRSVRTNSTGNPYMTVGGTGDVLAGSCGAFMAMGLKAIDAASCAAFLCGEAGDLASEDSGPGLLASDVIEKIPYILRRLTL